MIIEIYNASFQPIGQVQNVISLAWERKMYTASEFVIKTAVVNSLWAIGNIVRYHGKNDLVGYIEQVSYSESSDGLQITIRGRDVLCMMDWRILTDKWSYAGTPTGGITEIVTREKRGMSFTPNLTEYSGVNAYINYEIGLSLLDVVSQIAETYNIQLGYTFTPGTGVTMTGHYANLQASGVFSIDNGTLLSQEYDLSQNVYKNVVYAHNGGTGDEHYVNVVGTATGNARRELYRQFDVSDETGGVMPEPTDYFPGSVAVSEAGADYSYVLSNKWYTSVIPESSSSAMQVNAGCVILITAYEDCDFNIKFTYTDNTGGSSFFFYPVFELGKIDTQISMTELEYDTHPEKIAYCNVNGVSTTDPEGDYTYHVTTGSHYIMVFSKCPVETSGNMVMHFQQGNVDRDRQMAALKMRADVLLEQLKGVDAFTAQINPYSQQMEYAVDFNLGEWVTVQSARYGVSMLTQITGITETYDKSGANLNVTFGSYYMTQRKRYELNV